MCAFSERSSWDAQVRSSSIRSGERRSRNALRSRGDRAERPDSPPAPFFLPAFFATPG